MNCSKAGTFLVVTLVPDLTGALGGKVLPSQILMVGSLLLLWSGQPYGGVGLRSEGHDNACLRLPPHLSAASLQRRGRLSDPEPQTRQ